MFRTSRMLATATIVLWASGAAAQAPPPGGEAPSGPAPAAAPAIPPATPPVVTPPPAVPPPAQVTGSPAPQQGTPATVLDTQDYESMLGRSVRSAGGDELGRVIDIIVDKDGHPRAAIIDFGGFLGVGTRKIAVDWRALRFTPEGGKERRLSVALTRNQVRVSPEYKAGEPIVVLGPASPAAPAPEGDQAAAPASPTQASQPATAVPPPAAPAAPPEKAPDR